MTKPPFCASIKLTAIQNKNLKKEKIMPNNPNIVGNGIAKPLNEADLGRKVCKIAINENGFFEAIKSRNNSSRSS